MPPSTGGSTGNSCLGREPSSRLLSLFVWGSRVSRSSMVEESVAILPTLRHSWMIHLNSKTWRRPFSTCRVYMRQGGTGHSMKNPLPADPARLVLDKPHTDGCPIRQDPPIEDPPDIRGLHLRLAVWEDMPREMRGICEVGASIFWGHRSMDLDHQKKKEKKPGSPWHLPCGRFPRPAPPHPAPRRPLGSP